MNRFVQHRLFRRSASLAYHLAGIAIAYLGAFLLRFDFTIPREPSDHWHSLISTFPLVLLVFLGVILAFRLYRGLWTYFSFRDCILYLLAFGTGTLVLGLALWVSRGGSFAGYPRSVLPISFLLLLVWEIGGRMLVRLYSDWRKIGLGRRTPEGSERMLLVGSLRESDQVLRSVMRDGSGLSSVLGILCTDDGKTRDTLQGVPILGGVGELAETVARLDVDSVLILPPCSAPKPMNEILDRCSAVVGQCSFRVLPSVSELTTGRLDVSSIRKVEIKDLLERKPNRFDRGPMESFLEGSSVMVTGAGGSIGSEICRQVCQLGVRTLVMLEHSEFLLFEIENEIRRSFPDLNLIPVTADIRRIDQVRGAIRKGTNIDVIYHAAAYKHVHLMEKNVPSAFHNNVLGTASCARAACEEGVSHFVMISSDKAVRPTSIMGATKRIAERVLHEANYPGMRVVSVRFGNVLGSSGSVIPIFKKQIEQGGPVTVTSEETRRFFMTIPEAVELVLMAGSVGGDGDIMVLEMGEQVRIVELASRLITLSGLRPGIDIDIEFIGLRPGEKEYEELLTEDENVERTEHEKIWVMRKREVGPVLDPVNLSRIEELVLKEDSEGLRAAARRLVGENHLADVSKAET